MITAGGRTANRIARIVQYNAHEMVDEITVLDRIKIYQGTAYTV